MLVCAPPLPPPLADEMRQRGRLYLLSKSFFVPSFWGLLKWRNEGAGWYFIYRSSLPGKRSKIKRLFLLPSCCPSSWVPSSLGLVFCAEQTARASNLSDELWCCPAHDLTSTDCLSHTLPTRDTLSCWFSVSAPSSNLDTSDWGAHCPRGFRSILD